MPIEGFNSFVGIQKETSFNAASAEDVYQVPGKVRFSYQPILGRQTTRRDVWRNPTKDAFGVKHWVGTLDIEAGPHIVTRIILASFLEFIGMTTISGDLVRYDYRPRRLASPGSVKLGLEYADAGPYYAFHGVVFDHLRLETRLGQLTRLRASWLAARRVDSGSAILSPGSLSFANNPVEQRQAAVKLDGSAMAYATEAVVELRDQRVPEFAADGTVRKFGLVGFPELHGDLVELFHAAATIPGKVAAMTEAQVQVTLSDPDDTTQKIDIVVPRVTLVSGTPDGLGYELMTRAKWVALHDTGLGVSEPKISITHNPPPSAATVPAAASGLSATAVSSTQVDLSWTDNSDNEDGFRIERSAAGAGTWSSLGTVGAGTTTYSDTTTAGSTSYDYRVIAYNSTGDASPSNTANVTTPAAGSSLLTGLQAYWKFEEAKSASRQDSVGTAHFSDVGTTPVFRHDGKFGASALFGQRGNDAKLSAASQAALQITGDFTLAFWVKPLDSLSDVTNLFVKTNGSTKQEYLFWYDGSTSRLRFTLHAALDGTAATSVTASSFGGLTLEQWHLVVVRKSGTSLGIRVNNGTENTVTFSGTPASSDATVEMGPINSTNRWEVDEGGKWSRALTTAEMTELWNSGAGNSHPFDGSAEPQTLLYDIPAYWKLDEASGNAADSAGANTLSPVNNPLGVAGKISNGREFVTASNHGLTISSNTDVQILGEFSFGCWVKLNSKAGFQVIIGKQTSSSPEYLLVYDSGIDRFEGYIWQTSGSWCRPRANTFGSPSTGVWYFVALRLFNGQAQISVNMSGWDSAAYLGTPAGGSAAFDLGRRSYSGAPNTMNGVLDEVGKWNRGLSDAEFMSLYNSGAGFTHPFA